MDPVCRPPASYAASIFPPMRDRAHPNSDKRIKGCAQNLSIHNGKKSYWSMEPFEQSRIKPTVLPLQSHAIEIKFFDPLASFWAATEAIGWGAK
jgi:hypothetical protein